MFLETTSLPKAVKGLLVANVGFYIILRITGLYEWGVNSLALVPYDVLRSGQIWRLVTYLFIHANIFWHLVFNMFGLWMFGPSIERQIGTAKFIFYYFLTGIGGALCSVFINPNSHMYILGCSASILGLVVAFAVLFPDAIISMIFPPISMKAKHFAIVFGAIQVLMIFESQSGISWATHIGGIGIGYIYIRYFTQIENFLNFNRIKESFRAKKEEDRARFIREKLDPVLDKISKTGVDSLSSKEKNILKKAKYKV
jgi:membrane associated rhomboid family serine protease